MGLGRVCPAEQTTGRVPGLFLVDAFCRFPSLCLSKGGHIAAPLVFLA
jgi:hypothetical protein